MARLDEEPDPHCHRTLPYSGGMPCNGLIKTDVVDFGEALPDGAMEKSVAGLARGRAVGHRLDAGRYPAASIVPVAAQAGVPITIMNMGRTQCDRLASRLIPATTSQLRCRSWWTRPSLRHSNGAVAARLCNGQP